MGFAALVYGNLVLTVNHTLLLDITLTVGNLEQQITVNLRPPLLESGTSSSSSTIVPEQIESMPINGRNYLDLLQLVPGVAINRQAGEGNDTSAPMQGERSGNALFLIDGQPNRDEVNGGPAGQFNQDTVLEFQVVTSGYQAEFGHGSGGIINVVTKSGTNEWHGTASLFHRNYCHTDAGAIPASAGSHCNPVAAGDPRLCPGNGIRQEAPETVGALRAAHRGNDTPGCLRRRQQLSASTGAELYGHGDGDVGCAPALDHDLGHSAVSAEEGSRLHPSHPKGNVIDNGNAGQISVFEDEDLARGST